MSKIRSKNTKPEIYIRKILHNMGFRFRLHQRHLPGTPDIILKKWNTVIFVHGCFWHQHNCRFTYYPSSNVEYWKPKLEKNINRFKEDRLLLKQKGWNVIVIWECQIKKWPVGQMQKFLKKKVLR
jgi:DNA mismatch endonuclease (patch repair protein)